VNSPSTASKPKARLVTHCKREEGQERHCSGETPKEKPSPEPSTASPQNPQTEMALCRRNRKKIHPTIKARVVLLNKNDIGLKRTRAQTINPKP